jgi:phosphate transport system substrate-binding protein
MNRIRSVASMLGVLGVLGVVLPALAAATGLITISGSTASYPLLVTLANKYIKTYPHRANFKITQGGSSVGVAEVAAGRVTIADVARNPEESNRLRGLDFYPIAKYAICVVTNKSNPISNLDEPQVARIFTGQTRDWSEVLGSKAKGTIDLISRTSSSGVLASFQTLMLGGKKVASIARTEASEVLLKRAVERDPNAIGFVSNFNADSGGLNPVEFNGQACTAANAKSGNYGPVATFYEVTKGPASGAAKQFITWIDTSPAAQQIIASWWIPIH